MKKTDVIQVRVSDEEKMFIKLKALQRGVSVSELILRAVLYNEGEGAENGTCLQI